MTASADCCRGSTESFMKSARTSQLRHFWPNFVDQTPSASDQDGGTTGHDDTPVRSLIEHARCWLTTKKNCRRAFSNHIWRARADTKVQDSRCGLATDQNSG